MFIGKGNSNSILSVCIDCTFLLLVLVSITGACNTSGIYPHSLVGIFMSIFLRL